MDADLGVVVTRVHRRGLAEEYEVGLRRVPAYQGRSVRDIMWWEDGAAPMKVFKDECDVVFVNR